MKWGKHWNVPLESLEQCQTQRKHAMYFSSYWLLSSSVVILAHTAASTLDKVPVWELLWNPPYPISLTQEMRGFSPIVHEWWCSLKRASIPPRDVGWAHTAQWRSDRCWVCRGKQGTPGLQGIEAVHCKKRSTSIHPQVPWERRWGANPTPEGQGRLALGCLRFLGGEEGDALINFTQKERRPSFLKRLWQWLTCLTLLSESSITAVHKAFKINNLRTESILLMLSISGGKAVGHASYTTPARSAFAKRGYS